MQRLTRRLWTVMLSALAVTVILAALTVGLFRLVMVVAPSYRQQLTQWVSRAAGRPVLIGHMDLNWSHWEPTLDLRHVTLLSGHGDHRPLLKVRRLQVGFPLIRLVRGDLTPDWLTLVGLRFSVHRGAGGHLDLAVQGGAQNQQWQSLLARIAGLAHVAVRDARVRWHRHQGDAVFRHVRFTVDHEHRGRVLRLGANLPPAWGGRVAVNAVVAGNLSQPARLRVQGSASLTDVRPAHWLQPYLRPGVAVSGLARQVSLSFDWAAGRLQQARARVRGEALTARDGAASRWTLLHSLDFDVHWAQTSAGGKGAITRPPGATLPLTADLSWQTAASPGAAQWQLQMARLPLAAFMPWVKALRGLPSWAGQLEPAGTLESLRVVVPRNNPAAVAVSGRFKAAGVRSHGRVPGIQGLGGTFSADRDGGTVSLRAAQARVQAPSLFAQSLPVAGRARLQVARAGSAGWQISAQQVHLRSQGAQAQGSVKLSGLGDGQTPHVDLKADFSAPSVQPLLPYVPLKWPPPLRRWLHQAFKGGQISHGQVTLQGPLRAFPYPGSAGVQRIDFTVHDGAMDYMPGWPPVTAIDAHVRFRGRSLQVQASSGRMLGVALGPVSANIPDFRSNVLTIRGQAQGDSGEELAFLRRSPLQRRFQALLKQVRLKGPADLQMKLVLPLKDLRRARFEGTADLRGVRLALAHWPHPLTHIRGRIHFDKAGLSGQRIRARMLGQAMAVTLRPQRDARGRSSTQVRADTTLALPRDANHLRGLVPAFVLDHLRGRTPLSIALTVGRGIGPTPILIRSALTGMAVTLPPPLAKPASATQPLTVRVEPQPHDRVAVHVSAAKRLNVALRVGTGGRRKGLERGTVQLGGGTASLPAEPGLWIRGSLGQVNAEPWLSLLHGQMQQQKGSQAGYWLGGADLHIAQLSGYSQRWQNVRITLHHTASDWKLKVSGPEASGALQWPRRGPPGKRHVYDADFAFLRLHLPKLAQAGPASASVIDPGQWPGLRLVCGHCYLDKLDLGSVIGELEPVANGLHLTHLSLNGPDLQGEISGRWLRRQQRSEGLLHALVSTRHLGGILKDLGYAESITAQHTRLDANLAWQPSGKGLGVANLTGTLALDVRNGTLPTVNPGASRVLGLFNFYALPRRLSLDFQDVVGDGLAFDTIHGTFHFRNGNAITRGVKLSSPSMRMEMKGRIGLLAKDYDEEVTIHPQVGGSLPIAGAVLGGPVVGALVFLAQQLLGKPLDQVSAIRYHLGGTWSKPEISKR